MISVISLINAPAAWKRKYKFLASSLSLSFAHHRVQQKQNYQVFKLVERVEYGNNNWYNKKTRTNNNKMGRKNNTNNGEQFLVLSLSLSSTPPLTFIWLLAGNEKNISACHKHTNTDVHLRSCRCVVVAAVVLVVFNFGVALQKRVCAGASEIELHFTLLLCNQINKLSSARSRQLFNC